jgi:hypothetical protein
MRISNLAGSATAQVLLGLIGGIVVGTVLSDVLFVVTIGWVGLAAGLASDALTHVPFADPVYTRAALHSLADIRVGGIDAAGASVGCLVRILLAPGSSVLGRLVAAGVANSGVLAAAFLLVRAGLQRHRPVLIAQGVAMHLQVALGLLGSPPSLADLETIGLSFAINATAPWIAGRRLVVSELVGDVPAPIVAAGLVTVALVSAYVLAGVLVTLVLASRRSRPRFAPGLHRQSAFVTSAATTSAVVFVSALVAACEALPVAVVAAAPQAARAARPVAARVLDFKPVAVAPQPEAVVHLAVGDKWFLDPPPPSHVEVVPTGTGFRYVVNGVPQLVRGMGINTQYHVQLSADDRRARIDADLAEMRAIGINTLVGWDPAEFDGVLLDSAQRHGVGVVPPFDLDPDADYLDPAFRADLTRRVLAWVNQFRQYPAVRMWGLGNEVLHKIVHPAWLGPQDPHQAAEARAFADWLVQTADTIHAVDPDHPVTYRDAEDAYIGWLSDALLRSPATRPWFVFGTNCYTNYLEPILDNWPAEATGMPLWVSEFAPGGVAITDRPAGFATMWAYIRRYPDRVFGGAVYAWTRNGPEEIDRTLGLTNDGAPVDTASLEAITGFFGQSERLADPGTPQK